MPPLRQKILTILAPGDARFQVRDLPDPGPSDIVIRPAFSTFKHGTEMMAYSGRSPFAHRTFDPQLRLFEDRTASSDFYPRPMGSMITGEVEWAGSEVSNFTQGQAIYAWAPIADRHMFPASQVEPLGSLSPEAALCIDPASFALGAVIDGAIERDETVFVTGLGAIGLFVVQYCVACGARVVAASSFAKRRDLASRYGAAEVYNAVDHDDLAKLIKQKSGGAHAAIECSGNLGTLHQAIRAVKQCGRVVCVGFYGAGDSRFNLGEEFFHNRITLLASLPALAWKNPTRGHPPLYAKDLQRQVRLDFQAKTITPDGILDPILTFDEAETAVELISQTPESCVKTTLRH